MHFDFEVVLVGAVLVSGIVWLLDHLLFAKQRETAQGTEPVVVEYAKSFFPVLLVVMLLRSFVFEPFRIPSGSMMPTLLVGDFILVNKFRYGIRLPVVHAKLTQGSAVERGDVVVFRFPQDESLDFIKRVIGLPGDHISYYNKRLHINGEPLSIKFDRDYEGQGSGAENMKGAKVYQETIDEITHTMMIDHSVDFTANGEIIVPEGKYFVMGDNRDHSNDSRYWGFVDDNLLVGKAFMVWMHWDWRDNGSGLDVSRIGNQF